MRALRPACSVDSLAIIRRFERTWTRTLSCAGMSLKKSIRWTIAVATGQCWFSATLSGQFGH